MRRGNRKTCSTAWETAMLELCTHCVLVALSISVVISLHSVRSFRFYIKFSLVDHTTSMMCFHISRVKQKQDAPTFFPHHKVELPYLFEKLNNCKVKPVTLSLTDKYADHFIAKLRTVHIKCISKWNERNLFQLYTYRVGLCIKDATTLSTCHTRLSDIMWLLSLVSRKWNALFA